MINTANPHILGPHLACAAYELRCRTKMFAGGTTRNSTMASVIWSAMASCGAATPTQRARGTFAHWWHGLSISGHRPAFRSSSEITIIDHHTERLIGTVDEARPPHGRARGRDCHRGQAMRLSSSTCATASSSSATTRPTPSPGPTRTSGSWGCRPAPSRTHHAPHRRGRSHHPGARLPTARSFQPQILANETLDLPEQRLVTRFGTSSTTT